MATSAEVPWFKSSYSGGSGTECVECALANDGTLIRDSKRTQGPVVHVRLAAWRMFVRSMAQNELG
ncbi:DUF397 domain-containing protein [Streptomyces sp. NPDC042207]|uniref:DUF397 domain-containing protein n=1 Tax=Streptomyces sp. NPDC042207 TaxID=3154331 RepID=UPI0033F87BC5